MNKIGMLLLALVSLGMVACGGGPSKEDACGCVEDAAKDICEAAWDVCDDEGGKDGKECKETLQEGLGCD